MTLVGTGNGDRWNNTIEEQVVTAYRRTTREARKKCCEKVENLEIILKKWS